MKLILVKRFVRTNVSKVKVVGFVDSANGKICMS